MRSSVPRSVACGMGCSSSRPPQASFPVGARVECLISDDTWVPGRVIKLHYHESGFEPGYFAPYQIELDDGKLIYAPDDDDECIRAAS